jgi:hypothetical protein
LLKLNADYPKWTAGAPDEKTAKLYAFVHAATWADDIKRREYGYTRDNVNSATAGQNIGYSDHNQHAYWHFKDINFSSDGTPLPPPGRSRHPSEAYDRGHRNAFPVTRTPGDLNQSCFGLPARGSNCWETFESSWILALDDEASNRLRRRLLLRRFWRSARRFWGSGGDRLE